MESEGANFHGVYPASALMSYTSAEYKMEYTTEHRSPSEIVIKSNDEY